MKRIFTALAGVAIVNLAALIGLAAYAHMQHWLTKDRVRRAVAVLRGEDEKPGATSMPATDGHAVETAARSSVAFAMEHRDSQAIRTELDRRAREIEDAWKLLETQQLALVQAREAWDKDQARTAAEAQRRTQATGDDGLQKEVEVLGGIKAKQAVALLKQKQEADVVALLKRMEQRTVRKIVSECKTTEERQWIGRILEQMHDGRAAQAEVLDVGT